MRAKGRKLLSDETKASIGAFSTTMCHDLFLEDGVYVKRRGISRAVINVVPQMSRLPHHTQTVFCLLSKYQQEGRAETFKKGGIKVFSRTCASVCCWFLSTET